MSGQESARLQGAQEWAARALLTERLLPRLPKPAVLAVQIRSATDWLKSCNSGVGVEGKAGERWPGRYWLQKQHGESRPAQG